MVVVTVVVVVVVTIVIVAVIVIPISNTNSTTTTTTNNNNNSNNNDCNSNSNNSNKLPRRYLCPSSGPLLPCSTVGTGRQLSACRWAWCRLHTVALRLLYIVLWQMPRYIILCYTILQYIILCYTTRAEIWSPKSQAQRENPPEAGELHKGHPFSPPA